MTAPLWRLIESNCHVFDMNQNHHALLTFLDRASLDSSGFINGTEYPFENTLIEKDNVFHKLLSTNDAVDDIAYVLAQLPFKGLANVLRRAMKEQLNQSNSVIAHKIPERVFGILDFFLRYRPNASTESNVAYLMFALNKTSTWLDSLPAKEREKLLTECRKDGREIRRKYQEKLKSIEEKRKQIFEGETISIRKEKEQCSQVKS